MLERADRHNKGSSMRGRRKTLKPTLERSVWAVMDDDEVHRFTACEAFHRKDYRKLDACGSEM